jgi:predicted PurR-regulated permease PerM
MALRGLADPPLLCHTGAMMMSASDPSYDRMTMVSYVAMAAALLAAIWLHLLPALLGGLVVYNLVIAGARALAGIGVIPRTGKIVLLLLISSMFIIGIVLASMALASYVTDGPGSLSALFQKMADVVIGARDYIPAWLHAYLPENLAEWQTMISSWLRDNARYFGVVGTDAGLFIIHLIFGMVIGGMVAFHASEREGDQHVPLAHALTARVVTLSLAFRRIVFSQVRISALNTLLTAIFLAIVMPMIGYELPLVKTMIVVTFIVGLIPILGNIISNTVIFLIALSVSGVAAITALIYLIVIHKLEYFINAKIIGTEIRARAWEILLAMVVMESAFGIPGLIVAPIYYAYLKDELTLKKLI